MNMHDEQAICEMLFTGSADSEMKSAIETSLQFLKAVFSEGDTILFRPVEIWTENGSRKSEVDYGSTIWRKLQHPFVRIVTLRGLFSFSRRNKTNVFFGVCPRFGGDGRFDLSWQIRTVRVLWADIDHVTVEDALARVAKAGLPPPSIVVNSGNGVHFYWILDTPFQIDDVDPPPAIFHEWTEQNGKKRKRIFIREDDQRLYLDSRTYLSRLSTKALHIQDVITGIAQATGGDHTHDLARLLRLPGSLNRKDERSGRKPKPTQLVQCDSGLQYGLADFERFKSESNTTKRSKQIDVMPLPKVRKPTAKKQDQLDDLIAGSTIAETGYRSEADFALCCYAIRNGIAKGELWIQVQNVGKFAESGESYFDRTWSNAEHEVRVARFEKVEKRQATSQFPSSAADETIDANVSTDGARVSSKPEIIIDAANIPVGATLCSVTDQLLLAGSCFCRAGQLVSIYDGQISAILNSNELAGLLNQYVEFQIFDGEVSLYKPFPTSYGNTWLNQRLEQRRLPAIALFTRNPVFAPDWRVIPPGYDAQSRIYYAGPAVEPLAGMTHINQLLQGFDFKTPGDRTNFLGMLLTTVLMPHFIGCKPALLACANQAEIGKTVLAQIISIVRDGCAADTASYNPNDEEFEKRLGAVVRGGATTIIIDNAKSNGRNPRIDSACLERSITDAVLSFRLLGQSKSIRTENSHIFCITANSPEVSRDLITRCVVVNLYYEGDPSKRSFLIEDPEGYALEHRHEILGELLYMVEKWKEAGQPRAKTHTRFNKRGWGDIIGGILQAAGLPDFLLNASEAAEQLDETKREFAELVAMLAEHSKSIWTAGELSRLCDSHSLLKQDLGPGTPHSRATKMGTLAARFVNEIFQLDDERRIIFRVRKDRKGKLYQVFTAESAEP